jgi:hypothetical protein
LTKKAFQKTMVQGFIADGMSEEAAQERAQASGILPEFIKERTSTVVNYTPETLKLLGLKIIFLNENGKVSAS